MLCSALLVSVATMYDSKRADQQWLRKARIVAGNQQIGWKFLKSFFFSIGKIYFRENILIQMPEEAEFRTAQIRSREDVVPVSG